MLQTRSHHLLCTNACEGCGLCVRLCPEQAIDFPERLCGSWTRVCCREFRQAGLHGAGEARKVAEAERCRRDRGCLWRRYSEHLAAT